MAGKLTLAEMRRRALTGSLARPMPLGRAIAALGFVQADPIRAPARAQDLILRHRVTGYRAGDLERRFPRLGLEEDYLYAYGFMPRDVARLLHPRHDAKSSDGAHTPAGLAADVLAHVREQGLTHPAELAERFGKDRAVNGWGGFSKATTHALHSLHYHGLLRVARRRDGIRIYEATDPYPDTLPPIERMRRLVLLVLRVLGPVPEISVSGTFALLGRGAPGLGKWRATIQELLRSGELENGEVDGVRYLWPTTAGPAADGAAPRAIRFLAPFDPIVWDRRRFEHLWGWPYRFEAYTKTPQRQFGYYAMPLAWGDEVIGWVNATTPRGPSGGRLDVAAGFVGPRPKARAFQRGFDAEVVRLEAFLAPDGRKSGGT
jgi:uncharacterized protein YcaQ